MLGCFPDRRHSVRNRSADYPGIYKGRLVNTLHSRWICKKVVFYNTAVCRKMQAAKQGPPSHRREYHVQKASVLLVEEKPV